MKTLGLQEKGQKRLGDKLESFYTLEEAESSVDQLVDSLKEFISKEGTNVQGLIEPEDEDRAIQEYEALRRHLGVCAGNSEQDVWGFVRLLLKCL